MEILIYTLLKMYMVDQILRNNETISVQIYNVI